MRDADDTFETSSRSGPAWRPSRSARSGPVYLALLSHRVLKHHDAYFRARAEVAEATRALRAKPTERNKNRARDAITWATNAERRLRRSADKLRAIEEASGS